MADGINLDGFTAPKINPTSPWGTESYTEAPAAAFAASDMSAQGNAGLNQEGSSGSLPITGADESDNIASMVNM
jgi:hypothetical protein